MIKIYKDEPENLDFQIQSKLNLKICYSCYKNLNKTWILPAISDNTTCDHHLLLRKGSKPYIYTLV